MLNRVSFFWCVAAISLGLATCFVFACETRQAIADDMPFDFYQVRKLPAGQRVNEVYEGESDFVFDQPVRVQDMDHYGPHWSQGAHLLWHGQVGETLTCEFRIPYAGRYQVKLVMTKASDYGICEAQINGGPIRRIDLHSTQVTTAPPIDFGECAFSAGDQRMTIKMMGGNVQAKQFRDQGYLVGIDYLKCISRERVAPSIDFVEQKNSRPTRVPTTFENVQSILQTSCVQCHEAADGESNLNLQAFASKADFLASPKLLSRILRVVSQHEMPPPDEPPLTATQRQQLVDTFHVWLEECLRNDRRLTPVVMRRLNRYEYNNAVRDLFKLRGDIYPLPEKVIRGFTPYFNPSSDRFPEAIQLGNRTLGKNQIEKQILTGVVPYAIDLQSEHGFNNRGRELSLSPILMESFLQLGKSIVHSPEFDDYSALTRSVFQPPAEAKRSEYEELARERLGPILRRAFRRPIDDETLDRYVRFFAADLSTHSSFQRSMKNTMAAILSSPRFLYLNHCDSSDPSALRLDDFSLAARLSFFIWSSIPDAQLLELASQQVLHNPDVLRAQIQRMLSDPRSRALAENFARQWLRLDQLITAVPDFDRYTVYYSRIGCEQWKLGLHMMVEPLLLFESIMVEDRSIMLFVDSNYAYRSDTLHAWYTDPSALEGRANRNRFPTNELLFRRRRLQSRREGGVMTTAAVMTMTSSPLRTSPIRRGAWVATAIFNQPPPPPPDTIPAIEADDQAIESLGLTLRQRLEQHQSDRSCATCHQKIDPLGFAFENFDAIGRWRQTYRSGLSIDSAGTLFGQANFADVESFKDAILENPEWFMRGFIEHMLSYALGRELELEDRTTVEQILADSQQRRGQFSSVVVGVATSYPFLHRAQSSDKE